MCNKINLNTKKSIKKNGIGYKILYKIYKKYTNIYGSDFYYLESNENIKWNYSKDDGFCFFTNKKSAIKYFKFLKKLYQTVILCKIEYKDGICRQLDPNMIILSRNYYGLCKEFKILEEINV